MSPSPAALSDLLQDLFSAQELRVLLLRLPRGRELEGWLPEGVGRAQIAAEAARGLDRRGMVSQALFEAILRVRPQQASRVVEVAGQYGVTALPPPPHPTPAPAQPPPVASTGGMSVGGDIDISGTAVQVGTGPQHQVNVGSPGSTRPAEPQRSTPLRVFISYTAQDLIEHAKAAVDAVRRMEWVAIDHRDWSASGQPSVAWCREKVRSCDVLVVLVAYRYGWVPSVADGGTGERSITWLEVEEARAHGLDVLPLLVDEDTDWPVRHIEGLRDPVALERLDRFKSVLNQTIRATFSTPESVEAAVYQSLADLRKRRCQ